MLGISALRPSTGGCTQSLYGRRRLLGIELKKRNIVIVCYISIDCVIIAEGNIKQVAKAKQSASHPIKQVTRPKCYRRVIAV